MPKERCIKDSAVRFTHHPPSVLYVQTGKTARFVWNYTVDDKDTEFSLNSPNWDFYDSSNTRSAIATESNSGSGWQWIISNKCPTRLLNPTVRVSKESTATLVISNVTTADNGGYECSLVLLRESPKRSRAQLIVTVRPQFQTQPTVTKTIAEGQELSVPCTAIGPPTPNITWVQMVGHVTKSTGTGSATLRISTIRRDQNGTYECQARNNPNERPVTAQTVVTVFFKPAIDKPQSTLKSKSWNGNIIHLSCFATGLPAPLISWYKPTNQQITTGVNIVPGGSEVTVLTTADQGDYGQYKCRATNLLGSDEHVINVTQLFPPGTVTIIFTKVEASSIAVRWTKPADNGGFAVTAYLLEVSTKPPVVTVNTHTVITRLKANTLYTMNVYARNGIGYGVVSSKVIRTKKIGRPAAPELLVALLEATGSKLSVVLRWEKPADNEGNITRFTIYVKEVARKAEWTKYDVTDSKLLEYRTTRNIVYGKTYMFMVTAWNKYGESVKDEEGAKTVNTTATKATKAASSEIKTCACTEKGSNYCSAVLGVIIAILVLSLVFNALQFLFLKRKMQLRGRKESQAQNRTTKKTAPGESYENDLEFDDNTASTVTASHGQQPVQTGPEYEAIQPAKPNKAISSDDRSNYQGLNLSPNKSIQGTHGPVYEPLRTRSVELSMQHNDNEQHPYEPLSIRDQNPTYQSLQGDSMESAI